MHSVKIHDTGERKIELDFQASLNKLFYTPHIIIMLINTIYKFDIYVLIEINPRDIMNLVIIIWLQNRATQLLKVCRKLVK